MMHQEVLIIATTLLILVGATRINTKNQEANVSDFGTTSIQPRFSGVLQIIERVNNLTKLALKDTKLSHDGKPTKCRECRDISRKEKPVNCRQCRKFPYPVKPVDCSDIYRNGHNISGAYKIWPLRRYARGPLFVYCDMEDGGGWTVIQRRGDFESPPMYFKRGWSSYKMGFGDIFQEFWLGNENIFTITNQKIYQLRIDLRDFEGNFAFADYGYFWIEEETRKYTLHVGDYNGTAGDALGKSSRKSFDAPFSYRYGGIMQRCESGWWHVNTCDHPDRNLNGLYLKGARGVIWSSFKGDDYSLKDVIMKIRNKDHLIKASEEN